MAQYLIIGSGRTARHFSRYLNLLEIPFDLWQRNEPLSSLQSLVEKASHILLLISDSAIEKFYQENLKNSQRQILHFSGALEIPGLVSAHPLMSFSAEHVYELETYQKIPFVLTTDHKFSEILPGLPNPSFKIRKEDKALYHALCVLSGNFTVSLWQKAAVSFQKLGLPAEIQIPYMNQIFRNLQQSPKSAWTGPLARKDLQTVISNHQALAGDPYQKIYRAFVEVHFPEALSHLGGEQ